MKISKLFELLFVISITLLTACSPKIADKISFQSNPVIIDGQAREYQNMRQYINETKMTYSLTNDKKNLYLCLKTSDETIQRKIIRSGMEIWIDTIAKAKKHTGILFPLANSHAMNMGEGSQNMNGERQRPDITRMKQNFLLSQTTMQLVGFKQDINGLTRIDDNSGIKVKMNWDSTNAMVYEAVIPFRTFYKGTLSARDSTKIFALTINVNAITMQHAQHAEGEGGEGHHRGGYSGEGEGGGMQGGGEMSGGHRPEGNGMGDRSAMLEKNTFTKLFRLNMKLQ